MGLRIASLLVAGVVALFPGLAAQSGTNPASDPSSTSTKQTQLKNLPATYTNPTSGRQMYDAYCASCHGQGGKGNGPAASALKTPPTDLTQLADKNRGTFPESHVAQVIKGDLLLAAHGNKEMPVWGPVLLNLEQHDPAAAQLRVRNLTKYIAGMQQK
jgi:mono/diheme cytochrome c family protein